MGRNEEKRVPRDGVESFTGIDFEGHSGCLS